MPCCAAQIQNPQTPAPMDYEKQEQHKLQSTSHWQTIGVDKTGDLTKSLAESTGVSNKLHVVQSEKDSTFQQAFNE